MKTNFILSLLLILGLSACTNSYQYDVYVRNSTDAPIKIIFKSKEDKNNTSEQTLILKPKEYKRIISTKEIINPKDDGTKRCQQVAEYVKAFQDEKLSELQWCDENIQYELVDIGQAEFTIDYTSQHF